MDDKKTLNASDGNKYYPFTEDTCWIFNIDKQKWTIIPIPDFIIYLNPGNCRTVEGELMEILLDDDDLECICSTKDLFNYGCKC